MTYMYAFSMKGPIPPDGQNRAQVNIGQGREQFSHTIESLNDPRITRFYYDDWASDPVTGFIWTEEALYEGSKEEKSPLIR